LPKFEANSINSELWVLKSCCQGHWCTRV